MVLLKVAFCQKVQCGSKNMTQYYPEQKNRILSCLLLWVTPSIPELIWVKNVRAILVCGFLMKSLKKHILGKFEKNPGCRLGVTC